MATQPELTTEAEPVAHEDVVTSYADPPTRTVSGVPVIFLNQLAAVLDNWGPRVVDGIAAEAPGHHVR
jgi:hypothetical protein